MDNAAKILWARDREKICELERANSILLSALSEVIQEYYKICRIAVLAKET